MVTKENKKPILKALKEVSLEFIENKFVLLINSLLSKCNKKIIIFNFVI